MDKKTNPILMIAAGMKLKKKSFMNNNLESMYLNYGILGLATILYEKGYKSVRVFQGDSKEISEIQNEIENCGIDIKKLKYPIFISVPSFLAISWTLEFITNIRIINPDVKIIMGGRWVLDKNIDWIKNKFPNVNFFSLGCPDEFIDKLLIPNNWNLYEEQGKALKPFSKFEYTLLNNFEQYQPVIEICRGCGMKCEFCLEKDYPVSKVKSAEDVILEAKEICSLYAKSDLNFYFEASMFNPTIEWSKEFVRFYNLYKMNFNWRFETRVDTINLESVTLLSGAGLKVIDLGLESASFVQLKRMGKSKVPHDYLNKANRLLEIMNKSGVWAKLNILLYLGETHKTIQETIQWLDACQNYFKGVSVNPFLLYLNGEETKGFLEKITEITSLEPNTHELYDNGYTFVNLSEDISIAEAKEISNIIANKYMSKQDFKDLKSFCYTKILKN